MAIGQENGQRNLFKLCHFLAIKNMANRTSYGFFNPTREKIIRESQTHFCKAWLTISPCPEQRQHWSRLCRKLPCKHFESNHMQALLGRDCEFLIACCSVLPHPFSPSVFSFSLAFPVRAKPSSLVAGMRSMYQIKSNLTTILFTLWHL